MGKTETKVVHIVRAVVIVVILAVGMLLPLRRVFANVVDVATEGELLSYVSSGGEVRLVDDITVSDDVHVISDLVLDLNGHILDLDDKTIYVDNASFTVEDNSAGETGTITTTGNFVIENGSSVNTGTLIIDSGTIDCQGAYCIRNYDEMIINGGTISGVDYTIYNLKDLTMNGGYVTSTDLTVGLYTDGANFVLNDGTVETTSEDYIAISCSRPNTSFVMNGGTINAMNHNEAGDDGGSAVAGFKYTEITINGGTINAYGNAITGNGSYSGNNEGTAAIFTVNGGSISSVIGAGIYAPQVNGVTTITGGTISGATGIEIRAGTLNISGGTIIGNDEYFVNSGMNGLSTLGAAVSVAQHSTAQPITVVITGGNFSAECPVSKANPLNHDQYIFDQVDVDIKGGIFTGEILDGVTDNTPRGYTDVTINTSSSGETTIIVVPVNQIGYYLSANTSGEISITGLSQTTPTDYTEINVLSNCRNGYDVTMTSTVDDNNLYLNSEDTSPYSLSPISDNTSLVSTPNTWGYYISGSGSTAPTGADLFHPVPTLSSSPAIIRTSSQTASDDDINDRFRLYFGANIGHSLIAGTYQLVPDDEKPAGSIVYQITANPACTTIPIELTFNKNLDGEGGEEGDSTVAHFPTPSDSYFVTDDQGTITLRLSDKTPTRDDYRFVEWNTNPGGSGMSFQPDDIITIRTSTSEFFGDITLYAIWTDGCPGSTVCYDGNGADAGTMSNQTASANTGVALRASNYSRANYGFAGWNSKADGSGYNYGPQQNAAIPSSGGLYLFANWIASVGSLQTWTGANSMNIGDVTALTDERDGETYAVAKLADGNVWIIENLRLDPSSANITLLNTNHPTADFISAASHSSSSDSMCKNNNAACVDTVVYNTNNLDRTLAQSPSESGADYAWYSYGVFYNWYTATAGNGTFEDTGAVTGDICPAGWHLPTGNDGEFVALNTAVSGTTTNDVKLRSFANNFIRAGNFEGTSTSGRGTHGRYWSSTASEKNKAYRFGYDSSTLTPNNTYNKYDAFSVRCIYDGNRIPTSTVTVNFDEHVASVRVYNDTYGTQDVTTSGSTVIMVDNLAYTISAEFEDGYTINTWSTTGNGQIVAPTAVSTNYTVTETATLSLASKVATLTTYTINYDVSPSTDVISPDSASSYNASYTLEITDVAPTVLGSSFVGWSENYGSSTVDYVGGDTITLSNSDPDNISTVTTTLYAVYELDTCPAGSICYFGNGATSGTMSNQTASSNAQVTLMAPNYSRTGYGFAGWITSDGTIPFGPSATVTTPDLSTSGYMLYAKWIASAGNLQGWNGCSSMSSGDVTALTDSRDNNTYMVAKLADGNCWITENLRLNPSTATITAQNTHSPTDGFVSGASASSSLNSFCGSDSEACDNKFQYNTNNLNRSLTQSATNNNNSSAWYGYGVYYNWYTATAGHGLYATTSADGDVTGDICPAGWRLPSGGPSGEYKALNVALNNGATNNSTNWRRYPNNFVFSGEYKSNGRSGSNSQTRIWTATASNNNNAYRMGINSSGSSILTPENAFNKWDGLTVRCIYDE